MVVSVVHAFLRQPRWVQVVAVVWACSLVWQYALISDAYDRATNTRRPGLAAEHLQAKADPCLSDLYLEFARRRHESGALDAAVFYYAACVMVSPWPGRRLHTLRRHLPDQPLLRQVIDVVLEDRPSLQMDREFMRDVETVWFG